MRNLQKLLICFLVVVFSFSGSYAQQTYRFTIEFEPNSFALTQKSKMLLDSALQQIKTLPLHYVTVKEVVDSKDKAIEFKNLTQKRVETLQQYLSGNGLKTSNMKRTTNTQSLMVNQNFADSDVKEERQIEITVESPNDNLNQAFKIYPAKNNFIKGKNGTVIFFPANSLVDSKKQTVYDSVDIVLKECYEISDMILENLSTMSHGKQLETRGMIQILASQKGKPLYLQDNERIGVMFADTSDALNFGLFYGQQTPSNSVNWVNDDNQDIFKYRRRAQRINISGTIAVPEFSYPPFDGKPRYEIYEFTGYEQFLLSTHIKSMKELKQRRYKKEVKVAYREWKKGYDKAYEEWERDKKIYVLEQRIKAAELNKLAEALKSNPLGMDPELLQKYIFASANLGWINCDRFVPRQNAVSLLISPTKNNNENVYMVFDDTKSVLNPEFIDNNLVFNYVPINTKVQLIGITCDENGTKYAALPYTISKTEQVTLQYKDVKYNEIKKLVESISK